tara:strand:- start:365 stop:844 length:480 start_codon:yes stop_codon:yes gene_type:complete
MEKKLLSVFSSYINLSGNNDADLPKKFLKFIEKSAQENSENILEMNRNVINEYSFGKIILRDIFYISTCIDHLQPFCGKIYIEYIPNKYIIERNNIFNLCKKSSKGIKNIHLIGNELMHSLVNTFKIKYVKVIINAEYHCNCKEKYESKKICIGGYRGD